MNSKVINHLYLSDINKGIYDVTELDSPYFCNSYLISSSFLTATGIGNFISCSVFTDILACDNTASSPLIPSGDGFLKWVGMFLRGQDKRLPSAGGNWGRPLAAQA
jgi:hypothetical protein